MTFGDLLRIARLLPPGASVTLSRDDLLAALQTVADAPREATVEEVPEEWLTAEQCAAQLQVSPRWCYDHEKQLGARHLSRRCVRFSSRAVARYLGRRG